MIASGVQSEDALEWYEEAAKGRSYDPTLSQLNLSMAAIHTTSDLLTQCLYDICQHPDIINTLKHELCNVLREGLTRTSLHKLKLMASVIKESQRLKPSSIGVFSFY
jgi:cytochrome P450